MVGGGWDSRPARARSPGMMTAADLVNLSALIDAARCFARVRQPGGRGGVRCPACGGATVVRDGRDETQPQRQRYRCKACSGRFDDLTGTVLAGHHQPLRVWVLCLYLIDRKSTRLNSSHANISYAVFCLKKKK